MGIISMIVVGLIAGLIARAIMPGSDPMGWIATIILGIVGSFVGGWVFSLILGTKPTGLIISFIVALIGSVVLVAILHLVRREPVRTT